MLIFQIFLIFLMLIRKIMPHIKCINAKYPGSNINRFSLTLEQIPWEFNLINYDPPEYNSEILLNQPWADPPLDDKQFHPKWNNLDGKTNRKSHCGSYEIINNRPRNPVGRTGLKGRGILGKWGPNHAADPIVTRWKPDNSGRILQFCAIQRRDCNEWAIPGGMVDPGEQITETLLREFREEALNSLEKKQSDSELNLLTNFFKNGTEIYRGYVDDPRNTDNAWMETVAVNFHDETGEILGRIHLNAGDDAKNVHWMDITEDLQLYASHKDIIKAVTQRINKI